MAPDNHFVVLLSSFNGARYIEEQIDSILNQRDVTITLLVRDDGSTDGTMEIVRSMAAQHSNIRIEAGRNVGVIASFFSLLESAQAHCADARFFALADQDDVWNSDKLVNAASALIKVGNSSPLLYCSAIEYVDAELRHLGNSQVYAKDKMGFANAVVQNCATGCTIVLNRPALDKVSEKFPDSCVMHDWWIYLVVSAFGQVQYDPRVGMKYRQHSQNVMGVSTSWLGRFVRRWTRVSSGSAATKASNQLRQFDRLFGDELDDRKKVLVRRLANYKTSFATRLGAACRGGYHRQSVLDDLLVRILILIGKF